MVNLPAHGATVHIWPTNARVQDGPRCVSDGGRFLPLEGRDVVWGEFYHSQLVGNEIRLIDPRPAAPAVKAAMKEGK